VHLMAGGTGDSNSKAFLRRLVEERDDCARLEMEKSLVNWDEDRLLGALIEIQGETDKTEVLLRTLQLHRSIANGIFKVGGKKNKQSVDKQAMDIEAVRAEMTIMEAKLNKEEEVGLRGNDSEMMVDVDSSSKGWTIWAGPWIPKPIGVV
jgi:ribosomal biogenesis protein LAS1